jgi:hypothetical protein
VESQAWPNPVRATHCPASQRAVPAQSLSAEQEVAHAPFSQALIPQNVCEPFGVQFCVPSQTSFTATFPWHVAPHGVWLG